MSEAQSPASPVFDLLAPNQSFAFQLEHISSSSSSEKDPLIDEMQEKIGELLRVSQELSAAKNQIHALQETLAAQKQRAEHDCDELQGTIARLEELTRSREDEIASLSTTNKRLSRDNADLESKIEALEGQLGQVRRESETQVGQLARGIAKKTKEAESLKTRLHEAESSQSSSSDTIARHETELSRLRALHVQMREAQQRKEEEIARLTAQLQDVQEQQAKQTEAGPVIAALQAELQEVKAKQQVAQKKLEVKGKEVASVRATLQKALAYGHGFGDVAALHQFIREKEGQIEALTQEVAKGNNNIQRAGRMIRKLQDDLQATQNELTDAEGKNTQLEQDITKQNVQLAQITKTQAYQVRRLTLLSVYERVNVELSKQLSLVRSALHDGAPALSLRTLITLSVSLLRWRGLLGTEKAYTRDARNFWWIKAGMDPSKSVDGLVNTIATLKTDLEGAKEHGRVAKRSLKRTSSELLATREEIEKKNEVLKGKAEAHKSMEDVIQQYQTDIGQKVDIAVFRDLEQKLMMEEQKHHQARESIKQKEARIANLETSLTKAKQQYIHQLATTKLREQQLDDAKYELYLAQDGISYLKQGAAEQAKDILALERKVQTQSSIVKSAKVQCDVLAGENRRMHFQQLEENELDSCPDHEFVDTPLK
jgi:chromosome segregation ATPase